MREASIVEKNYIRDNQKKPVSELAKELNREVAFVKDVLAEIKKETPTPTEKKRKKSPLLGMMTSPDASKKGVVVMTEAASQIFDETGGRARQNNQTKPKYRDSIYKIHGD